jgi:hypothetical protein
MLTRMFSGLDAPEILMLVAGITLIAGVAFFY